MRFENWDVLLFPKDSKVPMKEFKTNCHVVHDTEFAYTHGSYGLPTMTCFMPGLSPGTPFNISLHCWKGPEISQFTRNYSKHPELVKFEARVLIDGRLVASSSFNRSGPWPQLINHSFDFTKNGDLEILKFPQFRSELLRQSYWSPADDVGRIKIIISEGFPRDSLTVPIERVKNIIAFAFQHAPLDVLEGSGIAWPNPMMWRRGPFNPTMPVPAQQHEDGAEAHLHSPRRRAASMLKATSNSHRFGSSGATQTNTSSFLGSMPNTQALLQRDGNGSGSGYTDPFDLQKSDSTAYPDWVVNFGSVNNCQTGEMGKTSYNPATRRQPTANRISSSDSSMPDYGINNIGNLQQMPEFQDVNFSGPGHQGSDNIILAPKVPANTPSTVAEPNFVQDLQVNMAKAGPNMSTPPMNDFFNTDHAFSTELATSLTHSLLNQPHPLPVQGSTSSLPAPEIKSRKENHLHHDTSIQNTPIVGHIDMRKVSQTGYSDASKGSRDASNNNSPPSQSTFSGVFSHRSISAGDFGNDLTNVNNVFTNPSTDLDLETSLMADHRARVGSEKGVKRTRQFTPASAKAIDDEDEPHRSSPRARIGFDDELGKTS
ncbi:hypothetical protein F5Y15DRAFT_424935 [Xylariaceae sp. FL0016]|nr:hypothetical protein F5Y15DRAFT_424935 [Xylariaceae sp. FL0016]